MAIEGIHGRSQEVVHQAKSVNKKDVTETDTATGSNAVTTQSLETSEQKGVIRNILDGHFKGVAAVRLRINFYEELSAIDNEAKVEALRANAPALVDAVTKELGEMQLGELSDDLKTEIGELQANFALEADALLATFNQDKDQNAYLTGLDTIYQALRASLTEISERATPEEEAEGLEVEEAAAVEEENPLNNLLSNLDSTFTTEFEKLSSSIAATTVLPPLSQPQGSGKAYDKFLAMYNELTVAPSSAPETKLIDSA